MTTITTIKHNVDTTNNFITHSISELTSAYVFVSRHIPWENDSAPPVASSSFNDLELELYQHLVFGKKIKPQDVAFGIEKIQWVSGSIYDQYDQFDGELFTKDFYVINSTNDVYKCIYNNRNNFSTFEPTLKDLDVFELPDGYKWKYMFTVTSSNISKFATQNFIPVIANTTVESASTPGSIDAIEITSSGSNYRTYIEGFLTSVANSTLVILPPAASANTNFYVGSSIYFTTGLGSGQKRTIVAYDGATKAAALDQPLNFYVNIGLTNVSSNTLAFQIGQSAKQVTDTVIYTAKQGYFQAGDNIIQSDILATAEIMSSNATVIRVRPTSTTEIAVTYPITKTSDSGTLKTGTVSITTGQSNVIGVGTTFATEYAAGDYIKIGTTSGTNIRRILSITNSTHLAVTTAWGATLAANTHYLMGNALSPTSISRKSANGSIIYSNLTGVRLDYDQASTSGVYKLGEQVTQVDANNSPQGANGTVAFANNTTLIVSSVGGTWTSTTTTSANFNASSNVAANGKISITSSPFANNDLVKYTTSVGNTVISGLANNTNYFVVDANSSSLYLASVSNGIPITLSAGSNETGHLLTRTNQLYILGTTSNTRASTTTVTSDPNITVQANTNEFFVGFTVNSFSGSSSTGNATITYLSTIPSSESQFIVSPTITITGDGQNAEAYLTINATSNTVDQAILINKGSNYTFANISITANSLYGSGAVANALIGPITGHGSDPVTELGAKHALISVDFSNTTSESYDLPTTGSYRTIGIIKEPLYREFYLTFSGNSSSLNSIYERQKFILDNSTGIFDVNEIVFQDSSNSAGVVTFSNTSLIELKTVSGTFVANQAGDQIIGLSSGETANVKSQNVINFTITSNSTQIIQDSTEAKAILYQIVSNNTIRVTNATGTFTNSEFIRYSNTAASNSAAEVKFIKVNNNSKDITANVGLKFINTGRLSLFTNTIAYSDNEYVYQDVSDASGRILSQDNDLDLSISSATDDYVVGDVVIDTVTNANGIVIFANTSYLKLSSVQGNFGLNNITCVRNANATVGAIYSVLVLSDVRGTFQQGDYAITGNTTGAVGYNSLANTYTPPDLIRNSGSVLFLENLEPFTRTPQSKETFKLVIKF